MNTRFVGVGIGLFGVLGLTVYWLSGIIVFTNSFSTKFEVSQGELPSTKTEIYRALNRMDTVLQLSGSCPNRIGDCWFEDGTIIVKSTGSSGGTAEVRISTEELTTFWNPTPKPERHIAFKNRVLVELEEAGFNIREYQ